MNYKVIRDAQGKIVGADKIKINTLASEKQLYLSGMQDSVSIIRQAKENCDITKANNTLDKIGIEITRSALSDLIQHLESNICGMITEGADSEEPVKEESDGEAE